MSARIFTIPQKFEEATVGLLEALTSPDEKIRNQVLTNIGSKIGEAYEGTEQPDVDRMFSYLSIAHGMHEAGQQEAEAGALDKADFLHRTAQLFIFYAVCEFEKMIPLLLRQTESEN